MSPLEELKLLIREKSCPFFTDEELEYYLTQYPSVRTTAYNCLLIKSENTTLTVSGLTLADTSQYFRRLAQQYKPNNSGILK